MALTANDPLARYAFYAIGGCCLGLGLLHYTLEGEGIGTVLEALMIGGLATVAVYTGYTLPERSVSRAGRRRAVALTLATAASFSLLALAVWLTWYVEGTNQELFFLLSFAASLGAAVGSRSSLYAVESEEQLRQAQELTKLLRINQRVLRHNLRNDLGVALGHLDNIERAESEAAVAESVRIVRRRLNALGETSDRARRVVSIWETDAEREFDLAALLDERAAWFRERYPDADLTVDAPEECRVRAHSELPAALGEALSNAVEHNAPGVSVTVSLGVEDGTATLDITDTGSGIPSGDRDAIGTAEETALVHTQGLGLWMIYWVVTKSGGTVEFRDGDTGGTTVRVHLPTVGRSVGPF